MIKKIENFIYSLKKEEYLKFIINRWENKFVFSIKYFYIIGLIGCN
jgi:hypothetical protein